MGRSAYWNGASDSIASLALGDANRGAFLALQSAVSTRRRPVATDPPSDGLLPVLSAAEKGRCYRGLRFGSAGPPCVAPRLLRGSRARRRDGRACALPLRGSGLRPQADRPQ